MKTAKILTGFIIIFLVVCNGYSDDNPENNNNALPGNSAVNGSGSSSDNAVQGNSVQSADGPLAISQADDELLQALQQDNEPVLFPQSDPEEIILDNIKYSKGLEDTISSMPVLKQGSTSCCIMFSTTEAMDILFKNGKNVYNVADSLKLGVSLSNYSDYPFLNNAQKYDNYIVPALKSQSLTAFPTPWGGTRTVLMLAQYSAYGLNPSPEADLLDGTFGKTESRTDAITSETDLKSFEVPPFGYSVIHEMSAKTDPKLVSKIKEALGKGYIILVGIPIFKYGSSGMTAQFYPNVESDNTLYLDFDYAKNQGNKHFQQKRYDVWAYSTDIDKRNIAGRHDLLLVGYCENKEGDKNGLFIVRNSWLPTDNDNGYNYIDYNYITNYPVSIISVYPKDPSQAGK